MLPPIAIQKKNRPAQSRVCFKTCLIFAALLFGVNTGQAAPCTRVKAQPDLWVTAKGNGLVQLHVTEVETDEALPLMKGA